MRKMPDSISTSKQSSISTSQDDLVSDRPLEGNNDCTIVTDTSAIVTTSIGPSLSSSLNGCNPFGVTELVTASMPCVVKKPSATSKLILQNMEEVLNSIKKKHRHKHRRKREQNKKAIALDQLTPSLQQNREGNQHQLHSKVGCEDMETETERKRYEKRPRKHHKKPLQEKAPLQENGHGVNPPAKGVKVKKGTLKQHGGSPLKSMPVVTTNNSILKHFIRTPKKEDDEHVDSVVIIADEKPAATAAVIMVNTKPANAFELMMSARNKPSIGANTSGKELNAAESTDKTSPSTAKVRRQLMLQEWADRKGGIKRKLEDEERVEFVDMQLVKRAKRLKAMLVNGSSTPTNIDVEPNHVTRQSRKSKKTMIITNSVEDVPSLISDSKMKPTKIRRRIKRLASVDSIEKETSLPVVDMEAVEFLAKLSSPTKKRDNLLGYFPKKQSPVEDTVKMTATKLHTNTNNNNSNNNKIAEENENATPKTRRTKKSLSTLPQKTDNADTPPITSIVVNASETPTGSRPRRSCASKARYDYDLQESPIKTAEKVKIITRTAESNNKKASSKAADDDKSLEIISLDDSNQEFSETSPMKITALQQQKLAPLFVRSIPKPNIAPELLRARQDFLRSGVPEKLRLEQSRQRELEQTYEDCIELFPSICHIQQFDKEEMLALVSCNINKMSKIKLRPISDNDDIDSPIIGKGKGKQRSPLLGILANCTARDYRTAKSEKKIRKTVIMLPLLENKRTIIKSWKSQFDRFPTYKCYNQIREKYRYFNDIDSSYEDFQQVTESFMVTRQMRSASALVDCSGRIDEDEDAHPPAMAPNGELVFSEKYKPMLFEQVLVNTSPVMQLREFLNNWSGSSSGKNSQTIDDSLDDSNSSSIHSPCPGASSVVLLGPVSSGKTNAVYALANDMNFNVLEINASMKRTGKKLMQELQEATQSHQVRKDRTVRASTGQTKAQQNLLKITLNGHKTKNSNKNGIAQQQERQQQEEENSSNSTGTTAELSQNDRKCLILIEDADVVFEQMDAGFVEAVHMLAFTSKRPVIIVANDPNCGHLQRLMQQRTINFTTPHSTSVGRFLSVLALMENCPICFDDLVALYLNNDRDLRRTLLELQFFIQSGGDRDTQHTIATKKEITGSDQAIRGQLQCWISPNKRRTSVDSYAAASQDTDDQLENAHLSKGNSNSNRKSFMDSENTLYMHRSLFTFYTSDQNQKRRVPFPVNFDLLSSNLTDLFNASKVLRLWNVERDAPPPSSIPKRRTRSPKKAWLNNQHSTVATTPLGALCNFYGNLITAAHLSCRSYDDSDRLMIRHEEQIAHKLVEGSLELILEVDDRPYNLYHTPRDTNQSLSKHLNGVSLRSRRTCALDYEPMLRDICRSERDRAAKERRSSRFYHYLFGGALNVSSFSTEQFNMACSVFQTASEEAAIITADMDNILSVQEHKLKSTS